MSRRMTLADVIAAEGFTPYNATNPNGYITGTYFNTTIPPLAAPRDSPTITGPFAFAGSGSIAGSLSIAGALSLAGAATAITDTGTAASWQLLISAVNNTLGASIKLLGDGATTPSKTLRVDSGVFQIVNDANSTALLSLTDAGVLTLPASPVVPTPAAGDSSTKAATTAFVAAGLSAVADIGRNRVQNALFRINQRAAGTVTTSLSYPVDRWFIQSTNGSRSAAQYAVSDADRAAVGDEDMVSAVSCAVTGGAAAGDLELFEHRIESVRTFAGKTVTLSFWAQSTVAGKFITAELSQNFGTGGSPSTDVFGFGATRFTLSQVWTRYSMTVTVPNVQGKTFGTAGNDALVLAFWMSAGSTWTARAANVGVQTATINLWGVQLEAGSAATVLEKRGIRQDLEDCQRFFQTGQLYLGGYGTAGTGAGVSQPYGVQMRAPPATAITANNSTNITAPVVSSLVNYGFYPNGTITATGGFILNLSFTASADL